MQLTKTLAILFSFAIPLTLASPNPWWTPTTCCETSYQTSTCEVEVPTTKTTPTTVTSSYTITSASTCSATTTLTLTTTLSSVSTSISTGTTEYVYTMPITTVVYTTVTSTNTFEVACPETVTYESCYETESVYPSTVPFTITTCSESVSYSTCVETITVPSVTIVPITSCYSTGYYGDKL